MKIDELLHNFNSLSHFREFMQEQINDGSEISRGKDLNDKSKEQKKTEKVGAEPPPEQPEQEGEEENAIAADGQEPPQGAIIDPVAAPGSQIKLGNKHLKAKDNAAKSYPIKLKGDKPKVIEKPVMKIGNEIVQR